MTTDAPALEVTGLQSGYGDLTILNGVDIEVARGEFVSLIGANGAGKTTLLMTVSGLVHRRCGTVQTFGLDTEGVAPHRLTRRGVGHVPQDREIFAQMTVAQNLRLGAGAGPRTADRRATTLDRVYEHFPRLAERHNQTAGTLSGGEQQMLAIGRALMGEPQLLLLDEPSAGLAPVIVDRLAEVMQQLNDDGIAVLLVEQNAFLALDLADRAYVMETGAIVEAGPTRELMGSDRVRRAYLGD